MFESDQIYIINYFKLYLSTEFFFKGYLAVNLFISNLKFVLIIFSCKANSYFDNHNKSG